MKKNQGFTLIELMIVVAIIAIIAAIAIPNLMRSKVQSNESAAIGNLKAICGAQVTYHTANNTYAANFGELTSGTPPFLDGTWDATTKQGYTYTIALLDGGNDFSCNADPAVMDKTGTKGFFVDSSGVIRSEVGAPATDASDPIGETGGAAP